MYYCECKQKVKILIRMQASPWVTHKNASLTWVFHKNASLTLSYSCHGKELQDLPWVMGRVYAHTQPLTHGEELCKLVLHKPTTSWEGFMQKVEKSRYRLWISSLFTGVLFGYTGIHFFVIDHESRHYLSVLQKIFIVSVMDCLILRWIKLHVHCS